mmetsp:Transcript_11669/g.24871  ORF Transcript_11669/g.24871 Transcript_11669/m.24871 type:complete len:244 (+) Transcript_11669:124-855(+)
MDIFSFGGGSLGAMASTSSGVWGSALRVGGRLVRPRHRRTSSGGASSELRTMPRTSVSPHFLTKSVTAMAGQRRTSTLFTACTTSLSWRSAESAGESGTIWVTGIPPSIANLNVLSSSSLPSQPWKVPLISDTFHCCNTNPNPLAARWIRTNLGRIVRPSGGPQRACNSFSISSRSMLNLPHVRYMILSRMRGSLSTVSRMGTPLVSCELKSCGFVVTAEPSTCVIMSHFRMPDSQALVMGMT